MRRRAPCTSASGSGITQRARRSGRPSGRSIRAAASPSAGDGKSPLRSASSRFSTPCVKCSMKRHSMTPAPPLIVCGAEDAVEVVAVVRGLLFSRKRPASIVGELFAAFLDITLVSSSMLFSRVRRSGRFGGRDDQRVAEFGGQVAENRSPRAPAGCGRRSTRRLPPRCASFLSRMSSCRSGGVDLADLHQVEFESSALPSASSRRCFCSSAW